MGTLVEGTLLRWGKHCVPSLPLACRRCSCRITASRAWSWASWRPLLPFTVSTCTTTAFELWSQASFMHSRACWSSHSQATSCEACNWGLLQAWLSCAYSTWLVTS